MPRCPACRGFIVIEPASWRCSACGSRADMLDAPARARRRQWALDAALRPASAECLPWLNVNGASDYVAPPPNPGKRGWTPLPATRKVARRSSPGAGGPAGLTCGALVMLPAT